MLTNSNIKAWSKCLFYEQQCLECKFCICSLSYFGKWLSSKCKERRSAHQLKVKALEMLRSGIQLVKSHGDDLSLEYLWNGDEYGFFGKRFESNGEKPRIWRTTKSLSPSACYTETNHYSLRKLRQRHCIWHRHSVLSRKTWRHRRTNKSWSLRVT